MEEIFSYAGLNRSILFSQQPIEETPGLIESLASYSERLARRHMVPRQDIEYLINEQYCCTAFERVAIKPSICIKPDAANNDSLLKAQRLATLTGKPSVRTLGLGWMSGVISSTNALKQSMAWCPMCVKETVQGRRIEHTPLLWLLDPVEACPIHKCWLRSSCPNCSHKSNIRNVCSIFPVECPICHFQLCHKVPVSNRKALASAIAVAEEVATALYLLRIGDCPLKLEQPDFRRVVNSALRRNMFTGSDAFIKAAGIGKSTLFYAYAGEKMSLRNCVKFALAADVSLAGLFCSSLWTEDVRRCSIRCEPQPDLLRPRAVHDWTMIQEGAERAIASHLVCSQRELANFFDVDGSHFRKKLPQIAKKMKTLSRLKQAQQLRQVTDALVERIGVDAKVARASGLKTTMRATGERLGVSRNCRVFKSAYHQYWAKN